MPTRLTGSQLQDALYGRWTRLGTIVATTTSKNNHDTATPFYNSDTTLAGKVLMVQPDSACFIALGTTNAVTASSNAVTGDLELVADERFYINVPSTHGFLACVAATGTTNLKVFEML